MRPGDRQRVLDVALALLGVLVALPVLVVVSVMVKLSSPGPVLHRAPRVGRAGRPFVLLKFRSMRVGASTQGPGVTVAGDRRVTRLGRWIRRSKLDELPQLFNVLAGDMAIVGPRPEDARYVATYSDEQREILRWRPGITSPASVRFRDEEQTLAALGGDPERAYSVLMGQKIAIDLEYFRRRSLWGDVRILAATARSVVR